MSLWKIQNAAFLLYGGKLINCTTEMSSVATKVSHFNPNPTPYPGVCGVWIVPDGFYLGPLEGGLGYALLATVEHQMQGLSA